jgi:hypothetical protein
MEGSFCLGNVALQPTAQLIVKLAGSFAFDSRALAEGFNPTLKLGGSFGSLFQLFNRRLQLRQIVLGHFLEKQSLLSGPVLDSDFVPLTICFATAVHSIISSSWQTFFSSASL